MHSWRFHVKATIVVRWLVAWHYRHRQVAIDVILILVELVARWCFGKGCVWSPALFLGSLVSCCYLAESPLLVFIRFVMNVVWWHRRYWTAWWLGIG